MGDMNELLRELNRLLEAKRAGNLDRMHTPVEAPSALSVEIPSATP
jgi:hypothetical protein